MSELGKNVIVSIIDTLDGPEEVVLDLDRLTLDEVKELIPASPDLLSYLVERTLLEKKD